MIMLSLSLAFLFISTATIIPHANSKPVMKKITVLEEQKERINNKADILLSSNIIGDGIFEWLIQLIRTIIQLVFRLIEIVQNIINIISLIENLINAIQILFQLIQQLIQLIQDLFPSTVVISFILKNKISNKEAEHILLI